MPILFYGDAHKNFAPLFGAVARTCPEHVVLLGDLDLQCPLRQAVAPVFAAGASVWWIPGNHDTHSEAQHDFLFADHPEGCLGGRVVRMECRDGALAVGGLGGVYREKVWDPDAGNGTAPPRFRTRADYVRMLGRGNDWRGGLPLRQRDTIFPEDHEQLSGLRCDVLATHEAPSTHRFGFRSIYGLAAAMHARMLVHGHQHTSYTAEINGVRVVGLDEAEAVIVEPGKLA